MSYNPDHEINLRKFRRRGETLFVKNLSPEMLASAYAGARVHALPSWYELPGLVTLEAAKLGVPVVVSRNKGTIEDYLGDHAFYCEPDSSHSIREAIDRAWSTPKNTELAQVANTYTWENTAKELDLIYEEAIASFHSRSLKGKKLSEENKNPAPSLLTAANINQSNDILSLLG